MQTETMNVRGMQCGGCTTKLGRALRLVYGVDDVQSSLASGEVTVVYDEHHTSPSALKAVVINTGFGVDGVDATDGHNAQPEQYG